MAVGCGGQGRTTVTGRVTRTDGSPVVGARVVARCPDKGISARGRTDANGEYELGGLKQGDGVEPGEYVVIVSEDRGSWDNPRPRTVSAKYEVASASGLTLTVEPGKSITYDLVLEQP